MCCPQTGQANLNSLIALVKTIPHPAPRDNVLFRESFWLWHGAGPAQAADRFDRSNGYLDFRHDPSYEAGVGWSVFVSTTDSIQASRDWLPRHSIHRWRASLNAILAVIRLPIIHIKHDDRMKRARKDRRSPKASPVRSAALERYSRWV